MPRTDTQRVSRCMQVCDMHECKCGAYMCVCVCHLGMRVSVGGLCREGASPYIHQGSPVSVCASEATQYTSVPSSSQADHLGIDQL